MKNYKNANCFDYTMLRHKGLSGRKYLAREVKTGKVYYVKIGVAEVGNEYVFNVLARLFGFPYCKCYVLNDKTGGMYQKLGSNDVIAIHGIDGKKVSNRDINEEKYELRNKDMVVQLQFLRAFATEDDTEEYILDKQGNLYSIDNAMCFNFEKSSVIISKMKNENALIEAQYNKMIFAFENRESNITSYVQITRNMLQRKEITRTENNLITLCRKIVALDEEVFMGEIQILTRHFGKDATKFYRNYVYSMKNVAGRILADYDNKYKYCLVSIEGKGYYFRCDGHDVEAGNWLALPLGLDNKPTLARVKKVALYTKDTVPYPLEQTKSIYYKILKL